MTILCIGDSLTYGYGVGRDETWCALASRLTGHRFLNYGVNGATTGEMLDSLRSFRLSADRPDAVFLLGGLNDLFMGMPLRIPLEHLRAACEHARSTGVPPVVGLPSQISGTVEDGWCDGPIDMGKVRAAYAEFAEALHIQCRSEGIDTIDLRPVLGQADLAFDGIHLNRQGHRRMAEAVAAYWTRSRD